MLISFAVENFRSIKDQAQLQLTAINYYKEAIHQLIDDTLPGLSGVSYLRSVAIFGPNASGKTSIWRALRLMRDMVLHSTNAPNDAALLYTPFELDAECMTLPTRFSIMFNAGKDSVRFEYSFSYNASAILEEELCAYPKGHRQTWFKRLFSEGKTTLKGSSYLKLPPGIDWLLNDNVLLLSLLRNLTKIELLDSVREVVSWFESDLDLYSRAPEVRGDLPYSGDIIKGVIGTDYQRNFIKNLMRKADIGITDTSVEEIPVIENLTEISEDFEQKASTEEFVNLVVFDHEIDQSVARIPYPEESDGTRQLFGLAGHIAKALENGSVLFVDELDASLHPVLVREIVQTFLSPKSNPANAQLIFTAHNPCLLENGLLRRDQIWLTEKDENGATQLYPLSDFSPRKEESIISGYLTGKYSAIPVVPACFGLQAFEIEG